MFAGDSWRNPGPDVLPHRLAGADATS